MGRGPTRPEERTPSELLGALAHDGSLLVRSELELAAAEHLPQIRRVLLDAAAALAAAVALILALGSLTWAAVRALNLLLPSWSGPLVAAGAWLLLAALLLTLEHPRRLARVSAGAARGEIARAARRTRDESEAAVHETAELLVEALARHAAARELKIAASAVERTLGGAEADVRQLLKEVAGAMSAGGRAGVGVLERVVGRRRG